MTVFVAPILIYFLWKFGQRALKFIEILVLISCAYAFKVAYENKFVAHELGL